MWRRAFFGSIAGAAAVAPALPAPVSAAPAPPPADQFRPTVGAVDPATLESCTAHFGLAKSNSTVINFDETDTSGITPAPTLGAGITPVVTVTLNDDTVVECRAERAWTDTASFDSLLRDSSFGNMFHQPAGLWYLIPGGGLGDTHINNLSSTPIDNVKTIVIDLVLDPAYAADFTVEWTAAFNHRNFLTVNDALAAVRAAERADIDPSLQSSFDTNVDATAWCNGDNNDTALEAALFALLPTDAQDASPFGVDDICVNLDILSATYDFEATKAHGVIPVAISATAAPTTTAGPTTTATGSAGNTLPPTGPPTSTLPTMWALGALVGAGGAMVLIARRRAQ
jgi:hypothetical protein